MDTHSRIYLIWVNVSREVLPATALKKVTLRLFEHRHMIVGQYARCAGRISTRPPVLRGIENTAICAAVTKKELKCRLLLPGACEPRLTLQSARA